MATGTIKRHDTEPSPQMSVNAAAGGAYDLTNHSVVMCMKYATTLSTVMDISQLTIELPADIVDLVELTDVMLIDHERVTIGGSLPVQPITGNAEFTITRGTSAAATAGAIFGSTDVAGTAGVNQYRLSTNAVLEVSVDSGAPTAVTVLAAGTTTNNTIADLVSDVQANIDTAVLAITVGNQNDKLTFTSDTTGVTSNVAISASDAIGIAELGIVPSYGVGTAIELCPAAAHAAGVVVNILKITRTAIIEYPATDGTITFEWIDGDTDKLGEYYMEFEITTPQGKRFTVPNNNSFSVEIVADFNDN